jgi:hypothetical protein
MRKNGVEDTGEDGTVTPEGMGRGAILLFGGTASVPSGTRRRAMKRT